ncbi:MAG: hypothetical protein ACI4XP_04855 [Acutalibacteraceae bacterium]
MKKNKYFSLSLMWEGIKQTKTLGICLTVVAVIVACFSPFMQILNGLKASFHAVTVNEFVFPIFSMFYFIPAIFVLGLFGFMNKRNSSDFYHSVPLNRSCVYITYAAATMVWCIFIMLVSTFSSYILYSFAPNVMITPYFIWIALYSSFIVSFLVMSIALVAMGLSGNFFSDIVTFLLLMFVPRLIISLFVSALSSAVPVFSVDSIPLLRPYINILFIPFQSNVPYSELLTDWGIMLYSIILAVVYFVGGFFIHRARKSESAESAVAFKGVRHIVRSLIGIVPTLLICYPLSLKLNLNDSKEHLNTGELVLGIGISVIAYFVYEFITTKSAKKLLYAIPLYLIVVTFDFAFIFGSQAIGNSIMNTVPVQSDIQSVSVKYIDEYYNNSYSVKMYQECKAKALDYENEELIKLFSDTLYSNLKTLKERGSLYSGSYSYYSTYKVTFHCKNGQNITRKVYVPGNDNPTNTGTSVDDKIYNLIVSDKNFTDMNTVLPENDEVKKVYITDYSGTIYSSQCTNEEMQKIWQTFRNEYVSLSNEDKQISCGYNPIDNMNNISKFHIYLKGYTGVDVFYGEYYISQKFTPRTYKTVIEIMNKYQKPLSSDMADVILSGINKDSSFGIDVDKINTASMESNNGIYYNIDEVSDLSAKDFENAEKAVKILTDAAQKGCDMSKDNVYMVSFTINAEGMPMQKFEDAQGGSYSMMQIQCFVNLTDEEYKEFCSVSDSFFEKQQNSQESMVEEDSMIDE